MHYSIIIPTLNESSTLTATLQELLSGIDNLAEVEIILSDGGSEDCTLDQASQFAISILNSRAGRAQQMNTGALRAQGDWLVFLHADTRLPENWMQLIHQSPTPWGRFNVRLHGTHWLFRIIESTMNLRSRITSVATGDQALFFRRDFFQRLGGYPDIPLMEDIAISKLARKLAPPTCLRQAVITSSRRWEENGILRTITLMWTLRLAYWLGIKPRTLQRIYYPQSRAG